jgi:hypothetical protein
VLEPDCRVVSRVVFRLSRTAVYGPRCTPEPSVTSVGEGHAVAIGKSWIVQHRVSTAC